MFAGSFSFGHWSFRPSGCISSSSPAFCGSHCPRNGAHTGMREGEIAATRIRTGKCINQAGAQRECRSSCDAFFWFHQRDGVSSTFNRLEVGGQGRRISTLCRCGALHPVRSLQQGGFGILTVCANNILEIGRQGDSRQNADYCHHDHQFNEREAACFCATVPVRGEHGVPLHATNRDKRFLINE